MVAFRKQGSEAGTLRCSRQRTVWMQRFSRLPSVRGSTLAFVTDRGRPRFDDILLIPGHPRCAPHVPYAPPTPAAAAAWSPRSRHCHRPPECVDAPSRHQRHRQAVARIAGHRAQMPVPAARSQFDLAVRLRVFGRVDQQLAEDLREACRIGVKSHGATGQSVVNRASAIIQSASRKIDTCTGAHGARVIARPPSRRPCARPLFTAGCAHSHAAP